MAASEEPFVSPLQLTATKTSITQKGYIGQHAGVLRDADTGTCEGGRIGYTGEQ